MQILDMSGLVSITTNPDNGERFIKGTFQGIYVEQTLAFHGDQQGVWVFNPGMGEFEFNQIDNADSLFFSEL